MNLSLWVMVVLIQKFRSKIACSNLGHSHKMICIVFCNEHICVALFTKYNYLDCLWLTSRTLNIKTDNLLRIIYNIITNKVWLVLFIYNDVQLSFQKQLKVTTFIPPWIYYENRECQKKSSILKGSSIN